MNDTAGTIVRMANWGQPVFAAILITLGILGLVNGGFIPVWDAAPKMLPARTALAYLLTLVSLGCGLGLFWPRSAAAASRLLTACLLLWLLLVKGRFIVLQPGVEVSYESAGETAVQAAAAWVLYAALATDWDRRHLSFAVGGQGLRLARGLYALALIAFGLSHFAYLANTASLVPGWLPAHLFWVYFTGSAYLAAGLAMLAGIGARLAAALSTLQMGLFTVMVWLPPVAAGHADAGIWSEFMVSGLLAAGGWVVADSYRGAPWVAARRH